MAAKLARYSWLPGGLAAALVIAMGRWFAPESVASLEAGVYDAVVRAAADGPSTDVVVVAIDEQSVEKLGPWPWPRDLHANLLDRLAREGAKVVAFTDPLDAAPIAQDNEALRAALALLEASDLGKSAQADQLRALLRESVSNQDPNAHLARAIRAHGNVVLATALQPSVSEDPLPQLSDHFVSASVPRLLRDAPTYRPVQLPSDTLIAAAAAIGHSLTIPDRDGTVRSDLTFARIGNDALPSVAAAVAARASDLESIELSVSADRVLVLTDQVIALDDRLRARPQYYPASGRETFTRIEYWRVLAGEADPGLLEDKIVLIGATDPALLQTPTVRTPTSQATAPVLATASAVSSYLQGPVYSSSNTTQIVEWLAAAGAIAFAAFVLPAAGALLGALATVLVLAVFVVTEVGLLSSTQGWARLMLPGVAAGAGYGLYLVGELIRRANVKNDSGKDSAANLRTLGQTFHRQGQLDLAFETYRRCPLDAATMELLYQLGTDFERRRQSQKAAAVYTYMANKDPNYRDLRARRARLREEPVLRPPTRPAAPTRPVAAVEDHDQDFFAATMPAADKRTLGRYEIERELGKGAMGTVYLGRDPKINRVVAIKAIPLADEFEEEDLAEARARFFREAEMAGRLNHPAIVTVYDAGEDQGLAYIAMEYLRGQHLSHFTDPSRLLPPKTVMLLVARVAEALHYAHRQNVVHRDIKPANIMFNPDTDELKITDFGIARLTDTSRTKTGIVLGTPSFMSPEQLEGRPLDGRSDQFALGVSLYQLLCGQLPFRAESMPRLMHKIATEPHASVRLIRPELPACIDAIIDRALAKDADQRYATCGEMALALRACAGAEEERQRAESTHEWLLP